MNWERLADGLWVFGDSCRVYAVQGADGLAVVNAGTGAWLDRLGELPGPVRAVLCTHFFRDHSAGAAEAARRGIAVLAPYWEQEQFADPLGLFQRRETFIIYDNIWDLYAPIEPIPVAGWLRDWETAAVAGLNFQVLPTPGATVGAVSLLVEIGGRRLAFCGEVIHSPGKVARLAPLQYHYNDLSGAVDLVYSSRLLRRARPEALLPSLGEPIMGQADAALAALEETLRLCLRTRPEARAALDALDADPLTKVTEHVYQSSAGGASTWFVISPSGAALSIDYGYHAPLSNWGYPYPRHRRALLHGLEALRSRFGVERIDTVILTHYHDDHVNGVPLLQRLHGTRSWAGENFAHILASPMGYNFPCTWPETVQVEPQPLGTPVRWREYAFTLHPMTGHTRWSTLVTFSADGETFAATGDQYFFQGTPAGDFDRAAWLQNHVYRNGASLDSFRRSCELLKRVRPTMILPGHGPAYRTDEGFFRALDRYAEEYALVHRTAMPLGDEQVHFDVDSRAGWLVPYRTRLDDARPIPYRATIRNPMPQAADLSVRLVGPRGWKGSSAAVAAGARQEVTADLTITPPPGTACRRQPIALELSVGQRRFGQVAEALVTIGPIF
jgi:glyoxylase-like metal-dependent hydrolase (beta-lactamase superfamily II)